jgi:NCAIR mutase (PurE)-related protein
MKNVYDKEEILSLLQKVKTGDISLEMALDELRLHPFSDLGYAKVDYHRNLRQGVGEIIFGQNKAPEHIAGILSDMKEHGMKNVLLTRISDVIADYLKEKGFELNYHPIAKLALVFPGDQKPKIGNIVIASGGTSDISVCEEAAITAETLGNHVVRLYDVGIAGLHRLLAKQELLLQARVIVAVAGMEGALASVVGGLVRCPVIAVPTSVGYGANFGGLSALLSMLNSCASGVSVVNIDNGFGAGFLASRINQMEGIS